MRSTLQRYRCAWRSSGGLSSEKGKAGVKVHFLYDLETFVPAFFHITKASVHDSKMMYEIPYESGSYYVFDRGYNAFKELFKIHKRNLNRSPVRPAR